MTQNNLFLVIVVLQSGVMLHAMDDEARRKEMNIEVVLPGRAEIKQSLLAAGFSDFVFKTRIYRYFTELTSSLVKIIKVVDYCIQEYDRPPLVWITAGERARIVECILCKSPEAYKRWLILEETKYIIPIFHKPSQNLFVVEKLSIMRARL